MREGSRCERTKRWFRGARRARLAMQASCRSISANVRCNLEGYVFFVTTSATLEASIREVDRPTQRTITTSYRLFCTNLTTPFCVEIECGLPDTHSNAQRDDAIPFPSLTKCSLTTTAGAIAERQLTQICCPLNAARPDHSRCVSHAHSLAPPCECRDRCR